MRLFRSVFVLVSATAISVAGSPVSATEEDLSAVLISRGEHTLTLGDMDARMSRFPAPERAQFARDPANLGRLMDRLLFDDIMAAEAREMGLDKDPKVRRDLELAVKEVLAIHRMNQLLDPANAPDFRQLAYERYLADPSQHMKPPVLVVEHVLIGTSDRSDEDAEALASQVRMMAAVDPLKFPELVAEYSSDPSKSSNAGRIEITDPQSFVPEFVAAAQNLEKVDEISAPVKTSYGYHVLRLIENAPARQLAFEEVEPVLVRAAQEAYRDNARRDYRSNIRLQLPESGNEALLITLPARYGGRPEEAASGAE
jgi:peptidyl-prolyl cis-trans isomerase C